MIQWGLCFDLPMLGSLKLEVSVVNFDSSRAETKQMFGALLEILQPWRSYKCVGLMVASGWVMEMITTDDGARRGRTRNTWLKRVRLARVNIAHLIRCGNIDVNELDLLLMNISHYLAGQNPELSDEMLGWALEDLEEV